MKQTKPFTPYPTRPIRMSDKTWNELKKQKLKTGKNWDTFMKEIKLENKKELDFRRMAEVIVRDIETANSKEEAIEYVELKLKRLAGINL